jgi:Helix-turn-helix domain
VTLVWERSRAKGSGRLVLLSIADYARNDGRDAYPSAQHLAERTLLTDRAVLLILHQLQAQGEIIIEPNTELRRLDEHGRVPRWFLHVRCVCEWTAYQREGKSEKISDSGDDLSPPGRPPEPLPFPRGRSRKSEKISDSAPRTNRKITYENPKNHVRKSEKSCALYKEGSLRDPEGIQRTGGCAPDSHTPAPAETPNFWLIVKLAHETLTQEGESANGADLLDALKQRLHDLGIPHYPPVDLVGRALDAARWQRKHQMSAS